MKNFLILSLIILTLTSCGEEKKDYSKKEITANIPMTINNEQDINKKNSNENLTITEIKVNNEKIINNSKIEKIVDKEEKSLKEQINKVEKELKELNYKDYLKNTLEKKKNSKKIYKDLNNQKLNEFEAQLKYLNLDLKNIEKKYPEKKERKIKQKEIENNINLLNRLLQWEIIVELLTWNSEKQIKGQIKELIDNKTYELNRYKQLLVEYQKINEIKNEYKSLVLTWSFDTKEISEFYKNLWIKKNDEITIKKNTIDKVIEEYKKWKVINITEKVSDYSINSLIYFVEISIDGIEYYVSEEDVSIFINNSNSEFYIFQKNQNNILKFTNSYNKSNSYNNKLLKWILELPNNIFKQLLTRNTEKLSNNKDISYFDYKSNIKEDITNKWLILNYMKVLNWNKTIYWPIQKLSDKDIEKIKKEHLDFTDIEIKKIISETELTNRKIINNKIIKVFNSIK